MLIGGGTGGRGGRLNGGITLSCQKSVLIDVNQTCLTAKGSPCMHTIPHEVLSALTLMTANHTWPEITDMQDLRMSQISPIMAARCLMFIHREIKYSQNKMVYRLLRASAETRPTCDGHPKHIHQQTLSTRCILALHFAIKYSNNLPCITLGICWISQMIQF